MSKNLKKFFKTEEGKKVLKENLKKLDEDFKNKKGWFSPEEDKYWKNLYARI